MTVADITDPEELREPVLPSGEYTAVITKCFFDRGKWGDLEDIQRLRMTYTCDDHPEVVEAAGYQLYDIMPVIKGKSNKFLNLCKTFSTHPKELVDSDLEGRNVNLVVARYERKSDGEPNNAINKVTIPDDEVE